MKANPHPTPHGSKEFGFTKIFKCGSCGSGISAYEKIKRLKDGGVRRYVYYSCSKKWMTGCTEPQIREEDLLEQLYQMIDEVDIQELAAVDRIRQEIDRVEKMITLLGGHTEKLIQSIPNIDARSCAKYILREESREEKRDLLTSLKSSFLISSSTVVLQVNSRKTTS